MCYIRRVKISNSSSQLTISVTAAIFNMNEIMNILRYLPITYIQYTYNNYINYHG